MFHCYIHVNLVKIHQPVHETDVDADAHTNGIRTKTMCLLPFGGGRWDIIKPNGIIPKGVNETIHILILSMAINGIIHNDLSCRFLKYWASSWETVSSIVSDQVRLKLGCSATEASMRLEILITETRHITLSRQRTIKALIRPRGCEGWSALLLFAYDIIYVFSWPGSTM